MNLKQENDWCFYCEICFLGLPVVVQGFTLTLFLFR